MRDFRVGDKVVANKSKRFYFNKGDKAVVHEILYAYGEDKTLHENFKIKWDSPNGYHEAGSIEVWGRADFDPVTPTLDNAIRIEYADGTVWETPRRFGVIGDTCYDLTTNRTVGTVFTAEQLAKIFNDADDAGLLDRL